MYPKVNPIAEIIKDIPLLAGAYGVILEPFDNVSTFLCNISTFDMTIEEATIIWQTILKTIVAILTMIFMWYRIKGQIKKNKVI